jgi:hypothetical protein
VIDLLEQLMEDVVANDALLPQRNQPGSTAREDRPS